MATAMLVAANVQAESDMPKDDALESELCTADTALVTDAVEHEVADVESQYELFTPGNKQREINCYIAVKSVMRNYMVGEGLLVDVRNKRDFGACHIPGAINIAPHEVRTKGFLKEKIVVLVSEGHSHRALDQLCVELKQSGFKRVSIMDGGLNAWQRQRGDIEVAPGEQCRFNRMTAFEFYKEKMYGHWLVVDLSATIDKPAEFIALLDEKRHEYKRRYKTEFILVANEDGKGYSQLERMLEASGIENLFFLEGGKKAFQGFVNQQMTMLLNRNPEKHGAKSPCNRL